MKAIKTTYNNNNITQSYYLVCRNGDNKYQLVAVELIIEFLIQKKKLLIILREC